MNNNLNLPDLIQTVNAQERQKRDHLIESNQLSVVTRDNTTYLNAPSRNSEIYVLNDTASGQLSSFLGIPPTLAAIAASTRRKLRLPSVTELITGRTPGTCRSNERWRHDRKCREYCEVRGSCDYAQPLISKESEAA